MDLATQMGGGRLWAKNMFNGSSEQTKKYIENLNEE